MSRPHFTSLNVATADTTCSLPSTFEGFHLFHLPFHIFYEFGVLDKRLLQNILYFKRSSTIEQGFYDKRSIRMAGSCRCSDVIRGEDMVQVSSSKVAATGKSLRVRLSRRRRWEATDLFLSWRERERKGKPKEVEVATRKSTSL